MVWWRGHEVLEVLMPHMWFSSIAFVENFGFRGFRREKSEKKGCPRKVVPLDELPREPALSCIEKLPFDVVTSGSTTMSL